MVNIDRLTETEQAHITGVDSFGSPVVGEGCILEVSSDSYAMKLALVAWMERLMHEEGVRWENLMWRTISEAKDSAFTNILKGNK